MRVLTIARAPMTCPLIRIDTNQGIYGLGEVRDGGSKNYALMLNSDPPRPSPTPMPIRRKLSRRTMRTTCDWPAPRAIRIPISCVRCATGANALSRRLANVWEDLTCVLTADER